MKDQHGKTSLDLHHINRTASSRSYDQLAELQRIDPSVDSDRGYLEDPLAYRDVARKPTMAFAVLGAGY